MNHDGRHTSRSRPRGARRGRWLPPSPGSSRKEGLPLEPLAKRSTGSARRSLTARAGAGAASRRPPPNLGAARNPSDL